MLEVILGSIFEKIIEPVIQPVGRHAGFLFHYKRNVNNLDDEVNNLQEQRTNVEGKTNEANRRGEAIDNDVSVWLDDADKTRQEVEEFRDEKTVKENMSCFSFSCPNFISRYRLSKEAERKVVRVKHLTEKGGNIRTVSHPMEDPPEVVFRNGGNYECFHSRDKVFKDIVKALKDPEVNMIGVYGTGGVGKTTMVTKVAEQVKKDGIFDEVIIAVVSQDANVIKIQEQLAEHLNLTLGEKTEVGRASRLWNRLKNGMKNLIILDDVWHELDLKEIGIPITDENKSCNVVLTSRNRDVLKNMCVHKDFKIEILCEEESWALFKKKVGNYVPEIARAVCKECQGLPVAINAIGAALKNKDMYAWEDALDKLKNSMLKDVEGIDQKVYASLKWSYDRLDSEDAKSCFLLCCLFPEDAWIPIDDLVRYYMAGKNRRRDKKPDTLEIAFNRVHTVVGTLQSCCLLLDDENCYKDIWKIRQDGMREVVKMHDVVRDVAISIAKDEQSFLVNHGVSHWPEKATYDHCSVISLKPNDMLEFPDQLVCQELHTLRLDCTENKFRDQVPERFFSGTENLMVLDLNSVTMSPILPASLAKLAKLQMLCLDGCKLADIAILKDLKDHLEILSLRRSDIEVLPPEVGELTRLRVLDMNSCKRLQVIPKGVISKLFRLEELYMPRTFHQWEGTRADGTGRDISCVSLDEIMSLTRLTTLLYVCILDPALLPKDFTFENLVRFDVEVGRTKYKSFSGRTDSSGVLKLGNIHLANPLEGLLGKPKWCRQRNGLYPSKSFNRLTCLYVTDCVTDRSWKYLFSPSSARGLVQLKTLLIEGCMDMEGVIGNEGEEDHEDIIPISFSRLNKLTLISLPNLKSFYPKKEKKATSSDSCSAHDAQTVLFTDKVALPALEWLIIDSMPEITEIWDKQIFPIPEKETESSFCHLKYMRITDCGKLMNVVGGCPKIEATVTEKQKGKEVDHYVTRFPKLTTLELWNLLCLESFCSRSIQCEAQPLFDHQVALPALERLKIDSVPEITEIWDKQLFPILEKETESSFCHLEYMSITDCGKLMNVVGGCPKIEATVTEKQKGKEVDHYVTRFPKLTTLNLCHLLNLESFCSRSIQCEAQPLFDHQVAFPVLESLRIESVPKVTEIWYKQNFLIPEKETESSFNPLRSMEIRCCDKLMHEVAGCQKMEPIITEKQKGLEVDDYATRFPKLTTLTLGDLLNLESFCSRSIRCEAQPLFDHQVAFPVLKTLDISSLPNITDIWDKKLRPAESFCQLERLNVFNCSKLVNLVQSTMLPQLRNLQSLRLNSCLMVGGVIDLEKREEETKEVTNNTIVPFPELTSLDLGGLQNFKGFCTITSEEQPVNHAQVAFPKLESLRLYALGGIVLQQLLGACEPSTKTLFFSRCDELSTVVSPRLFRRLRNVDLLFVKSCIGVREVFHVDGLEVGEGQECVGSLIQVRKIQLDTLPQLTCLWNKDPRGNLCLRNLEYLTIKDCPLLRNLLTASVAKALGGLKALYLRSCSTMEEVIATDEGHEEVIDDEEIVFPKLEWLILKDLSNLKSLCSANYNFNLPSLKRVVVKRCPNMQTFTSGSVRMPPTLFTTRGDDGPVIQDLNKHLEQQHLKGDQETIEEHEMYGAEEKFSFLELNLV